MWRNRLADLMEELKLDGYFTKEAIKSYVWIILLLLLAIAADVFLNAILPSLHLFGG